MIIYRAVNKINGKVYVGQTVLPLHRRMWQDPEYRKKQLENLKENQKNRWIKGGNH